jgi:hypothetical protein
MRRMLLIVLVVLLPLQWSGAAAAVCCLHGQVQRAHGDRSDAMGGHALGHAHAAHGHPGAVHAAHAAHDGPPAHGDARAVGDVPGRDAASVDGALPGLGDCDHGDCGQCCHGTGTAPPVARVQPSPPAFGMAPAPGADASPVSPTLDGPFRPPRSGSA